MLLVHFKKAFPLIHFTWALIWKKSCFLITVLFWNLPWYFLFLHRQSRPRMVNTLLMIKINPTCKRLVIFICKVKKGNLACISNKQVNKLLNIFFHRCSYKISCLVSWHNSSSVLVLIFASELPQNYWHCIHNTRID